ncbi:MAG: type II secretion system protein [bacterium]
MILNQIESENTQKAFTLIELLIALSIFSIAAVTIISVFQKGLLAWKKGSSIISLNQKTRAFSELFSRELRNIRTFSPIKFSGETSSISFPNLSTDKTKGCFNKTTYYFDSMNKTIVRNTKSLSDIYLNNTGSDEPMLTDVEEFKLEYAYSSADQGLSWKELWDAEDSVPKGLKIHLKLLDNENKEEVFSRFIYIPAGYSPQG